jgi:DNA-binding transcriptional MerR regulator
MTENFDQFINTILENFNIQKMRDILSKYQKKILSLRTDDYDVEPGIIQKKYNLRQRAINEYQQFIDENFEELQKTDLYQKIKDFEKTLNHLQRY